MEDAAADVAMSCPALLRCGIEHLANVRAELMQYMQEHEYDSISQMRVVLSQQHCAEPAGFERANHMKVLKSCGQTVTVE